MSKWTQREDVWSYNIICHVFPSEERAGYLYASVLGSGQPSRYFPESELAEAMAWVEAVYALGGRDG